MIITDLEHLDEISEETNIVIGSGGKLSFVFPYAAFQTASDAVAIGSYSFTSTYTSGAAVSGVFSTSHSEAQGVAVG